MSIRVTRGNINETKLKWRCAMECWPWWGWPQRWWRVIAVETGCAANFDELRWIGGFGEVHKDAAELRAWAIGWKCIAHRKLLGELLRWDGGIEGGRRMKMASSVHNSEASAGEASRRGQQLIHVDTMSRCVSTRGWMVRGWRWSASSRWNRRNRWSRWCWCTVAAWYSFFFLLFLQISNMNSKSSKNKSCSPYFHLQLCFKDHPLILTGLSDLG
jgi:hypothetical protein